MNNVKLLMLMLIPLVLVSQEVEEVVVTANKKRTNFAGYSNEYLCNL